MFKWLRSRRGESKGSVVPQQQADDASGEDEYQTEEELDREADPAGELPRIKTDDI
jgi:hypothetical protein